MGRSSIQARVVGVSGAASSLNLNPNGGDVLFTGSGNVGIGVTSPDFKLDVAGDVRIEGDSGLYFGDTGTSPKWGMASTGLDLLINNSTTNGDVVFLNDGGVGIGVSSPGAKLDVSGTIRATAFGVEQNNSSRIFAPSGGSYNGSGSQTGYLIVQLPNNGSSGVNNMMTGVIRVFDYTTNESFDVNFAGYWYSGYNWTNCSAWIDSTPNDDRNFTVRFGRDTATGTRPVITIGESNSTWTYLKFNVINFTAGHSNTQLSKWDDGWSCSLSSTLPMTTLVTNSNLQVNNWKRNGQDVYYGSGTGNVGIGTVSPGAKLEINRTDSTYAINLGNTDTRAGLKVITSSQDSQLTISGGSSASQYIQASNKAGTSAKNISINAFGGNVGIGTTSISYKLDVGGNGRFTSTVTATNFILSSDKRLKNNIEEVSNKHIDVNWKTFENEFRRRSK